MSSPGTDMMNIAAFKGLAPATEFAGLDPHQESLSDGIGSSYGIVGYKGKVWSLRLRGQTYNFVRQDDGSPAAFLDVIVLRQMPAKSKSYYPPGTYSDGNIGTRPICAALDGITPDADIAAPQAASCAICPRNVFKVNAEGRKTRECADYKRLAVLIVPKLTKDLLGAALMEPVFLRVPAASLNDLALLGEGMTAQGFHFSTYITRIGFDPTKPHPQMKFSALQPLAGREAALVMPLRDDPTSYRITGENDTGRARPKPAAQVQHTTFVNQGAAPDPALAAAAAKAAQDLVDAQKAVAVAAAAAQAALVAKAAAPAGPQDMGFGDVGGDTAAVSMAATTAAAPAGAIDTGFGDATAPASTVLSANTTADVGDTEEGDDELDARIAGILPK